MKCRKYINEAAEYFNVFNTLFSEKSPIAIKEARLAAVAVSAAIKCVNTVFQHKYI